MRVETCHFAGGGEQTKLSELAKLSGYPTVDTLTIWLGYGQIKHHPRTFGDGSAVDRREQASVESERSERYLLKVRSVPDHERRITSGPNPYSTRNSSYP